MMTDEYVWDRFVPTSDRAQTKPVQLAEAPSPGTDLAVAEPKPGVIARPTHGTDIEVLTQTPSPPASIVQGGCVIRVDTPVPSPNPQTPPTSRLEVSPGGSIHMVTDSRPTRASVAEVTGDTFYVDLNAIAQAVKQAQANDGRPVDESKRIYVGKEGELLQGSEVSGSERVAEVTGDTFYVDLNAIAQAVKQAQANTSQPDSNSTGIYVGREGELLLGNEVTGSERVAEVTGDTFYATRLEKEREFVRTHMPANTRRMSDGTVDGWYFTITNEFGDTYGLFLYYHKGMDVYRVALVEPRLEGKTDAHGGHLWADGHLCLTKRDGSGYKSIEKTYAKAALWTRGMSCYRRGYGFQFNIGQD